MTKRLEHPHASGGQEQSPEELMGQRRGRDTNSGRSNRCRDPPSHAQRTATGHDAQDSRVRLEKSQKAVTPNALRGRSRARRSFSLLPWVLRFPHEHLCQGPPSSNSQDGGQGEDGEALASGDIGKTQNCSKQYCNVRFKDITSNVHSRHE